MPLTVTTTELQNDLDRYLELSATEDIYITDNGRVISMLTNPFKENIELVDSLAGIVADDLSLEEIREERRRRSGEKGVHKYNLYVFYSDSNEPVLMDKTFDTIEEADAYFEYLMKLALTDVDVNKPMLESHYDIVDTVTGERFIR